MHFLITGHTGFKGSWLSLLLKAKGHDVSGISLNPESKSLFLDAKLNKDFEHDIRLDVRDLQELKKSINLIRPDVVIHLAAQPLVRESYKFPLETFEINVIGTLNILEAIKEIGTIKATLIITTDKVYKNFNQLRGYVETDPLGGDDPYSASKAAADIATQSWAHSFPNRPIAIARAGNVIGGGDWAKDRLIPDLVKAYSNSQVPLIRYPKAIRPWQHVLDCLNGYLILIDKMITDAVTGEWNFGPENTEKYFVSEVVAKFANYWGIASSKAYIDSSEREHLQEAGYLLLDSTKSRTELGWSEKLNFDKTISWTAEWYKKAERNGVREITEIQISDFLNQ